MFNKRLRVTDKTTTIVTIAFKCLPCGPWTLMLDLISAEVSRAGRFPHELQSTSRDSRSNLGFSLASVEIVAGWPPDLPVSGLQEVSDLEFRHFDGPAFPQSPPHEAAGTVLSSVLACWFSADLHKYLLIIFVHIISLIGILFRLYINLAQIS